MNRKKITMFIIAVQVCFFVGWYMVESNAFGSPIATIKVKPEPYDPRDLLSGQYMRLNYEFSNTRGRWNRESRQIGIVHWAEELKCSDSVKHQCSGYGLKQDGNVWVTLQKGEDTFYHPIAASFDKPKTTPDGAVLILGNGYKTASNLTFGIEKYFVKEGTREPNPTDTTIMLDVYENGKVRINTLLVKGKQWP